MTRVGSFSGPTFAFGVPLQTVHPIDNKFPQFDPEVEALSSLTPEQKAKLQEEIENVFGAIVAGRDTAER